MQIVRHGVEGVRWSKVSEVCRLMNQDTVNTQTYVRTPRVGITLFVTFSPLSWDGISVKKRGALRGVGVLWYRKVR